MPYNYRQEKIICSSNIGGIIKPAKNIKSVNNWPWKTSSPQNNSLNIITLKWNSMYFQDCLKHRNPYPFGFFHKKMNTLHSIK